MKMVLRLTLFIMLFLHAALYGQTTPTSTAGFTIGTNRAGITLAQAMDAAGDSVAVERAARIAQDAIHSAAILALDTSGTVAYADTARRAFTSARNDSIKVDSLNTKIRLDSLCLVNLNFSRATYSNKIWTIPNDANKAAPAYMYGGLGWNVPGSDSSGISRDSLTGRAVMALDGSAGDSAVTAVNIVVLDSTDTRTIRLRVKPRNLSTGTTYTTFYASRLDTSGTSAAGNTPTSLALLGDTLRVQMLTPAGGYIVNTKIPGIFQLNTWVDLCVLYSIGKQRVWKNTDSVYASTSTLKIMRSNRIRLGGINQSTNPKPPMAYAVVQQFRRSLTSAERLTLYNNSLRGIQPPGPSMGEVIYQAGTAPRYFTATAAETTSPGHFYAPTGSNTYRKTVPDSLDLAVGVALDSVTAGQTFRLQTGGTVRFAWYNGLITPGKGVVNDSLNAGKPAPSDSTRTNTKLMQSWGMSIDSTAIWLDIEPGSWIYRGN